jgi:hypothetical protein
MRVCAELNKKVTPPPFPHALPARPSPCNKRHSTPIERPMAANRGPSTVPTSTTRGPNKSGMSSKKGPIGQVVVDSNAQRPRKVDYPIKRN